MSVQVAPVQQKQSMMGSLLPLVGGVAGGVVGGPVGAAAGQFLGGQVAGGMENAPIAPVGSPQNATARKMGMPPVPQNEEILASDNSAVQRRQQTLQNQQQLQEGLAVAQQDPQLMKTYGPTLASALERSKTYG